MIPLSGNGSSSSFIQMLPSSSCTPFPLRTTLSFSLFPPSSRRRGISFFVFLSMKSATRSAGPAISAPGPAIKTAFSQRTRRLSLLFFFFPLSKSYPEIAISRAPPHAPLAKRDAPFVSFFSPLRITGSFFSQSASAGAPLSSKGPLCLFWFGPPFGQEPSFRHPPPLVRAHG